MGLERAGPVGGSCLTRPGPARRVLGLALALASQPGTENPDRCGGWQSSARVTDNRTPGVQALVPAQVSASLAVDLILSRARARAHTHTHILASLPVIIE